MRLQVESVNFEKEVETLRRLNEMEFKLLQKF